MKIIYFSYGIVLQIFKVKKLNIIKGHKAINSKWAPLGIQKLSRRMKLPNFYHTNGHRRSIRYPIQNSLFEYYPTGNSYPKKFNQPNSSFICLNKLNNLFFGFIEGYNNLNIIFEPPAPRRRNATTKRRTGGDPSLLFNYFYSALKMREG